MSSLPDEVIRKLDIRLGTQGRPHMRDDYTPTPCFGWALKADSGIGWDEDLMATLMDARKFLTEDPVVAYLGWTPLIAMAGSDVQTFHHGHPLGIVVAPTSDQFEVLEIEGTSGPNWDLDTEDITEKLRQFDAAFGVDIILANMSGLLFFLRDEPSGEAANDLLEWVGKYWAPEYPRPKDLRRIALWWD